MSGFTNGNDATCGKDAQTYCEYVLVRYDLPFPAGSTAETYDKQADFRIDSFDPPSVTDFDLHVYSSDATGAKGDQIGESLQNSPQDPFDRPEHVTFSVESTRTYNADGTVATENITTWVLGEIVYFQCPNSMYKGTAKFL
ncbi:MAG: hypothetical protein ABR600_04445 [Actinomycetota bacterium]